MPEANAKEWSKLAISSDATSGNLSDLKEHVIGQVQIRFSKRSTAQTRQSDTVERNVPVKGQPGFTLDFSPEISETTGALRILLADVPEQAVDFQLPDGGNSNSGIKLTGTFRIDLEDFTSEEDGRKTLRAMGRPAGTDWTIGWVTD